MPILPRKDIVVELNDQLLSTLEDKFWYAPVSTSLSYNGKLLPALQSSVRDYVGSWNWGVRDTQNADATFGITLGTKFQDDLTVGKGFLWGGGGKDSFRVFYENNAFSTVILDLKKGESVNVDLRIYADQKTFDEAVQASKIRFSQNLENLSFSVFAIGKNFQGSVFDDLITAFDTEMVVHGGAGDDTLVGYDGADTLYGDAGNDLIDGGGGKDVISGGAGADTISVYDGDTILDATAEDTLIVKGFNVKIGRTQARIVYDLRNYDRKTQRTIQGGDYADILQGSGQDTLIGGRGADTFFINNNDVIRDLERSDSVYLSTSNSKVINAWIKRAREVGASLIISSDFQASRSDVSYTGSVGHDVIYGSFFNDTLFGANGDDEIFGSRGNDEIHGGSGNDTLKGDEGSDTLFGDSGNDFMFDVDGDNSMRGGDGDDTLSSGGGVDYLYGDAGNDVLNGMGGQDYLWGGTGQDTLNGGNGDDELHGDRGNDVVLGGAGSDTLFGDDGNDTLAAGSGDDTLYGGNGADLFVFVPGEGNGINTIMDFTSGIDKIDLSAFSLMQGYDAALVRRGIAFDSLSQRLTVDANGDGYTDITIDFRDTSSRSFNITTDIVLNNLYQA